jgi:hypothetical protein
MDYYINLGVKNSKTPLFYHVHDITVSQSSWIYDSYNPMQDRRNRKSRTTSMEIESMKDSTETENKVVDPESCLSETTNG